MEFKRYMSLKRFGRTEVDGIDIGRCFIFPKIDGTNSSCWLGEDGIIYAGSRNRLLDETSTGDTIISSNINLINFMVFIFLGC